MTHSSNQPNGWGGQQGWDVRLEIVVPQAFLENNGLGETSQKKLSDKKSTPKGGGVGGGGEGGQALPLNVADIFC